MKKPDEIKKGLNACRDEMSVCDEVCPYEGTKPFPKCRQELLGDARDLIRTLEGKTKYVPVIKGSYTYACSSCGYRVRRDEIRLTCKNCGRSVMEVGE